MDIKVGDIVKYRNTQARVMRIVENDDGTYEANIAAQGFDTRVPIDGLELIESVKLSKFEPGDMVIVHTIPTHEKKNSGCGWMTRMSNISNGQPHRIEHSRTHPEEGLIVQIQGYWFSAYHVTHEQNYDMI